MRFVFLSLLIWQATPVALAAVSVEVRLENGTTGGPGTAQTVQLVRLGNGMEILTAVENPTGSVTLSHESATASDRLLVQAVVGRAIYSQRVDWEKAATVIQVFENSTDAQLNVRLGTLAFYAHEGRIEVGIFYNLDNASKPPVTLDREDGTFTFPVIPNYDSIEVSTRRGEMPLKQNVAVSEGQATLAYPLKPGRTILQVQTAHPYASASGTQLEIPLPESQKAMHVLALPSTLELQGLGIKFISVSERENVRLYEWTRQEGQTSLTVSVSGKAESPQQAQAKRESTANSQNRIEAKPNAVGHYRWAIVSVALVFLLSMFTIGFVRH